MNKSSKPVAVTGLILFLLAIAGYFYPVPHEALPTRVLMENERGRVVFTHKTHAEYPDVSCLSCHHELRITNGVTGLPADARGKEAGQPAVISCVACHDTKADPDFVKNHQEYYAREGGERSCISCHHTQVEGFAKAWDHEAHMGYASDDCQACHHTEDIEPQPQACSNCHDSTGSVTNNVSLKAAGHARCSSCHEDLFEEKLTACSRCHAFSPPEIKPGQDLEKSNITSCAACHEQIPQRMDAFHNQCFSCHDQSGKGPGAKAPCEQCHTR